MFGNDKGADWATTGQVTNPTPATRIAALADLLLGGPRLPLAVGRTTRTATNAQRRALATRDHGCIIPGCHAPPESCQTHHLHEWAFGGHSDLSNLVLLCWTHHRQVDLHMWTITPATPEDPTPDPDPNAPPGTPWPANSRSPFTITRQPRTRWRQ
ncbi:MAG: HNH endonuclease signature motif containing protein [Candidatus Nanopelagicales bacterium]